MFISKMFEKQERMPLFTNYEGLLLRYDDKYYQAIRLYKEVIVKQFAEDDSLHAKYFIVNNHSTYIFTDRCLFRLNSFYELTKNIKRID